MAARRADEAPRRIRLQPALTLPAVPDSILGPQHPPPPLAIQYSQVAHRDAEGPGLERPNPALFDQVAVTELRVGEGIDSHEDSIARDARLGQGRYPL